MTINDLKRELKLSDEQLDATIEESDLYHVAECYENADDYLEKFELSPAQQTEVEEKCSMRGVLPGIKKALKFWRNKNPLLATYRALLNIILSLKKGDVAVRLCKYLADKCECFTMCSIWWYCVLHYHGLF